MAIDYIFKGPPTSKFSSSGGAAVAIGIDVTNGKIYYRDDAFADSLIGWQSLNYGGGGSAADTVQTFSSNSAVGFSGGTNSLVLATAGVSGITLSLVTAVGVAGQTLRIKKVDSAVGTVTIGTSSAQTIDGASTYVLTNFNQYVLLESDGSNWQIVGNS